jgi:hypothetical protein
MYVFDSFRVVRAVERHADDLRGTGGFDPPARVPETPPSHMLDSPGRMFSFAVRTAAVGRARRVFEVRPGVAINVHPDLIPAIPRVSMIPARWR